MTNSTLRLVQSIVFCASLLFTTSSKISAQPVIGFTPFIAGLTSPVKITNAGDGSNRLFIVEQGGTIRIYDGGMLPTPFLDVSSLITAGGEQGLLSLVFHPNYATNGYFFIYYTNTVGDVVIARYQVSADPNIADAGSGVILLTIAEPFTNHNGGDMHFGPDGYLYFATGDGGSTGDPNNYAQDGASLLGKMIRIDVDDFLTPPFYIIPLDNPYVGDPAVDDLIWTIGLRNPWRWSFDRSTGDMWIGDVGQGAAEEINFRAAGATGGINYGWRCYEGNSDYNIAGCSAPAAYVFPIFDYPHDLSTGGFAVTGGYVYRGAEYPILQGYYICADYVSGNAWLIRSDGGGGWITRMQAGLPGSIVSFGEAEDATLYAVSLGGNVYKVDVTAVLPLTLLSFSGASHSGYNDLKWKTADQSNIERFVIEYSTNGTSWQAAGAVPAVNQTGDISYSYRHYTTETGKILYHLRIEEIDGKQRYSPIIVLNSKEKNSIRVYPTILTNNILQVSSEKMITRINIIDGNGRLVMEKVTGGQQGYFTVSLPTLSKGMYWVQLQTDSGNESVKIIIK
jgi:glucose/arabinose dehydrogenase